MMVATIVLYSALLMVNVFFAWLVFIGQQPFMHRWQVIAWHLGLAVIAGATAQFAYHTVGSPTGWQLVVRFAWSWCLIIGLIVIAQWLRRIVHNARDCANDR